MSGANVWRLASLHLLEYAYLQTNIFGVCSVLKGKSLVQHSGELSLKKQPRRAPLRSNSFSAERRDFKSALLPATCAYGMLCLHKLSQVLLKIRTRILSHFTYPVTSGFDSLLCRR